MPGGRRSTHFEDALPCAEPVAKLGAETVGGMNPTNPIDAAHLESMHRHAIDRRWCAGAQFCWQPFIMPIVRQYLHRSHRLARSSAAPIFRLTRGAQYAFHSFIAFLRNVLGYGRCRRIVKLVK